MSLRVDCTFHFGAEADTSESSISFSHDTTLHVGMLLQDVSTLYVRPLDFGIGTFNRKGSSTLGQFSYSRATLELLSNMHVSTYEGIPIKNRSKLFFEKPLGVQKKCLQ